MNGFAYRGGVLHAEEVSLARIAAEVGTPLYCYSSAVMAERYATLAAALAGRDARIYFALKANSNLAVVRGFARQGAGADVVSAGELARALAAGIAPADVAFSGVGKTRDEIAYALECGIGQFNVESEPEIAMLAEIAAAKGNRAVAVLRVNPDVDAATHDKIATGRKHDKFGIAIARAPEIFARAAALPGIELCGLAVHIGSQLTTLAPFRAAFLRLAELVGALRTAGHAITRLDLGGGLGIVYDQESPPTPTAYAALIGETVGDLGCRLVVEPGRYLVGEAGVLLTRVIAVKDTPERRFVIIDAAMNDLIRPALYDAFHRIVTVAEPAPSTAVSPVDVVGPVCETGDILAKDRPLAPVAAGDLLAILSAGAYGAVMASSYNTRPLVPEILVRGRDHAIVRPRLDVAALMALDRMPPWLQDFPSRRVRGAAR